MKSKTAIILTGLFALFATLAMHQSGAEVNNQEVENLFTVEWFGIPFIWFAVLLVIIILVFAVVMARRFGAGRAKSSGGVSGSGGEPLSEGRSVGSEDEN